MGNGSVCGRAMTICEIGGKKMQRKHDDGEHIRLRIAERYIQAIDHRQNAPEIRVILVAHHKDKRVSGVTRGVRIRFHKGYIGKFGQTCRSSSP